MSQIQKRPHHDEDSETGSSKRPRSEPDRLTFRRRDGTIQPTHTWNTKDDVIALRTPAREDPATHEATFLASRTLLCRDTLVFSDILSLPSPEKQKSEDSYEGHPLIVVQDHPQDLQVFLEAIHDWRAFSDSPKSKSIPAIMALLRLGTKYQVAFLRDKMIQDLTRILPQSPAEVTPPALSAANALLVLATLEEVEYPFLLPIAALCCVACLARTTIRNDDIRSSAPAENDSDAAPAWFLNENSRARVLDAFNANITLFLHNLIQVVSVPDAKCTNPAGCSAVLPSWRDYFAHDNEDDETALLMEMPPHCLIRDHYDYSLANNEPPRGTCAPCASFAESKLDSVLTKTWVLLPKAMGMGTWEELRARSKLGLGDESDEQNIAQGAEG